MAASFFFYDLETSGLHAGNARIMQFAGQRTDAELNPIEEPVNVLIKLAGDVLPEPEAILLTGITPQQTLADGLTEAEFLKYFYEEVVKPQTTFLGFNSVRFDDEFMRYLHYRNFYDPYEWHWCDDCSRWDILDLVRMTRALRPDGINWPFTDENVPTNRLELLTKLNGLEHDQAHDALSDVYATINVTKLIRDKQPELFKYLFECRGKNKVKELVLAGKPFVYTTGKYPADTLNTSAAVLIVEQSQESSGLVFDLRYDPKTYAAMSVDEITDAWRFQPGQRLTLPVKTLKFNRCPAIAPLGVLSKTGIEDRLQISVAKILEHHESFKQVHKTLAAKMLEAKAILDNERTQAQRQDLNQPVDCQLYNGFIAGGDKPTMAAFRQAAPTELSSFAQKFNDKRLQQLVPLYKARNFPRSLTTEERAAWDQHCAAALFEGGQQSRLAQYFSRLKLIAKRTDLTDNERYLLEEMQLYGESIMPSDAAD